MQRPGSIYFWQGSYFVPPVAGLLPPWPKPAGIRGFAKLKPGCRHRKAVESLLQGLGEFYSFMGAEQLEFRPGEVRESQASGSCDHLQELTLGAEVAQLYPTQLSAGISSKPQAAATPGRGRGSLVAASQGGSLEADSPLHRSVQQVEECLEHHMLHALAGVVQLGCEEGDGGS